MPLLPLQTLVDYQLLYCGRQAPHITTPGTPSPQQLWPIGQDSVDSGDDYAVDGSAEPSIFYSDLATGVHVTNPSEVRDCDVMWYWLLRNA